MPIITWFDDDGGPASGELIKREDLSSDEADALDELAFNMWEAELLREHLSFRSSKVDRLDAYILEQCTIDVDRLEAYILEQCTIDKSHSRKTESSCGIPRKDENSCGIPFGDCLIPIVIGNLYGDNQPEALGDVERVVTRVPMDGGRLTPVTKKDDGSYGSYQDWYKYGNMKI